jgi:K+-transporting ATPase ATPase C chain
MNSVRRQLVPATVLLVMFAVICGIIYPAVTWAVGTLAFHSKVQGSFVTRNGQVVGSSLIAQNFADKDGNPLPQYFQPRPSNAGAGYDPTSSGASNLGPGDPRLVGFIPGLNTVDLSGNTSATNPFATAADPYCVPTDATTGSVVTSPSAGQKYAKNKDGSYVCYSSTIPERAIAYRQLNSLPANALVPNDAVTAGYSGLDPDISPANADLQAARVAQARKLPVATVLNLVSQHTNGRQVGFLGEKTVNVLDLNLALDRLPPA